MVLSVSSQEALETLREEKLQRLPHVLIRETEGEFAGQATAIGVVPLEGRDRAKKALSSLPLLR